MATWVFVLAVGACASGLGQVCFKADIARGLSLRQIPTSLYSLLGMGLYVLYFASLVFAYRQGADVSVAYPLTSLAFVSAPLFGWVLLRERFGWGVPLGVLLILLGCWLVAGPSAA
jgi:drug/metabolite transporter (DMT)-like permease